MAGVKLPRSQRMRTKKYQVQDELGRWLEKTAHREHRSESSLVREALIDLRVKKGTT